MHTTRRHSRAIVRGVVAAVLTFATAVFGLIGARAAGATAATVTSIGSPAGGGIEVRLFDPGALWVQVTVRASTAPDAVALASTDALTQFDYGRGWYTDTPIQLPADSAYIDYPVDVDYRLASGAVQHWVGADHGAGGLFHYRHHLSIAAPAFDRATTDYDHPTLTLHGTVESFDPTTAATTPVGAGVSVRVDYSVTVGTTGHSLSATVTTAADGTFTATITPGGSLRNGSVGVTSPPVDSAADPAVPIPDVETTKIRVRIAGGPAELRVHTNTAVTVSGTVQRLTPTGWQPLVGADVVTTSTTPDVYNYTTPGRMGSGSSDAAGRYSYRITATRTTAIHTYVHYSEYVTNDLTQDGQLWVPTAGSFPTPVYSIDAFHKVLIHGYLYGRCGNQRVVLQYSADGHTGWAGIGAVDTPYQTVGHPCPYSVSGYGATVGYYRVTHAESNDMLAASSSARRLTRIPTRVVSFSTSPTRPYLNARLTATGRILQLVNGSWSGLRSAVVVVVFRPKGSSTWYLAARGTADAYGRFSIHSPAYGDGSWAVFYSPDSRHYYSESAVRYVDVR